MTLLEEIVRRHSNLDRPFLLGNGIQLETRDLQREVVNLEDIHPGDVVALIGDFEARSLATFLSLVDHTAVVVPLTKDTANEHEYFFEAAEVTVVIEDGRIARRDRHPGSSELLGELRRLGHPGLVLFSSGTTGRPKAILHDFTKFLARYRTPRPTLRTLTFLLFDHIGGINTLFHTLFNGGQIVAPSARTPQAIIRDLERHRVELLPTTPTFLRLLLLEGLLEGADLSSLKVVTYGTERMDHWTLNQFCNLLPKVDFRQTYGMSELGILRVKSRARDSLYMKVGGEGVETRLVDGVLQIRSENRMLGYLNSPSPFDQEGWYDTGDVVDQDGEYLRIVGRSKDIINVGGIKVLPSELERVALLYQGVLRAKARGIANPITGQHIEIVCQPSDGVTMDRAALRSHFRKHLPSQVCPHVIRVGDVPISHRFKQM